MTPALPKRHWRWPFALTAGMGFAALVIGIRQPILVVAKTIGNTDSIESIYSFDRGVFGAITLGLATIAIMFTLIRAYAFSAVMTLSVLVFLLVSLIDTQQQALQETEYLASVQAQQREGVTAGTAQLGLGWVWLLAGSGLMLVAAIAGARNGPFPSPEPHSWPGRGNLADNCAAKVDAQPSLPPPTPPTTGMPPDSVKPRNLHWFILLAVGVPFLLWGTVIALFLLLRG